MARNDRKTEVQHYVPKLLLRRHQANPNCKAGSEQIWVFDKHSDKAFRANIKNISAESGFYDFKDGVKTLSIEAPLSQLEAAVKGPIDKIIAERSLANLTPFEKRTLADFAAVQFVRIETFRVGMRQLNDALAQRIIAAGGDPENVKGFRPLDENDIKTVAVDHVVGATKEYAPHFLSKTWCLVSATESDPFYIGDTPVALFNERDFSPYGNIGLAVPGIEIYFPISATLSLWIVDPENIAEILAITERARLEHGMYQSYRIEAELEGDSELVKRLDERNAIVDRLTKTCDAIKSGSAMEYSPDVVTRLNSIQVRWAGRFVMCSKRNFELVERMISKNERYRKGTTFELA